MILDLVKLKEKIMKKMLTVIIVGALFFGGCSSKRADRIKKYLTKDCKFNSQNSRFNHHDIVWTGGCLNGYLSGEGILTFYTKEDTIRDGKYFGYMRNGMMNDTFAELYPPTPEEGNVIYKGGFKNNLKHGYGEYWKPMRGNRIGLLFKIKSKNGKTIDKNYVGIKPVRKNFSENGKSLAQKALESIFILGGVSYLAGKKISDSLPSSSYSKEKTTREIKRGIEEAKRGQSTTTDASSITKIVPYDEGYQGGDFTRFYCSNGQVYKISSANPRKNTCTSNLNIGSYSCNYLYKRVFEACENN